MLCDCCCVTVEYLIQWVQASGNVLTSVSFGCTFAKHTWCYQTMNSLRNCKGLGQHLGQGQCLPEYCHIIIIILNFLSHKSHADFPEGSTEGRAWEVIDDGIEHAVEVGKADTGFKRIICSHWNSGTRYTQSFQDVHGNTWDVAREETYNENQPATVKMNCRRLFWFCPVCPLSYSSTATLCRLCSR